MSNSIKSRAPLCLIALACSLVTPVLAQDPPTATEAEAKATQQQADLLKAQTDLVTQQNALATARLAPLHQFAGEGNTTVDNGGGAMESAYLAAVSLRDIADLIDHHVQGFLHPARPVENGGQAGGTPPAPPPAAPDVVAHSTSGEVANEGEKGILVLSGTETLSFERIASFDAESEGIIHSYNMALGQDTGLTCRAPVPVPHRRSQFAAAAVVPMIGAILSIFQSDVHVQGISDTPDDTMLIAALAAAAPGRYLQQEAMADLHTHQVDIVRSRLAEIDFCEDSARHQLLPAAHPSDERKELLGNLLKRSEAFHARLTTAAADGSVPLTGILREAAILNDASPYILRVHINRSGGTMITHKDILSALGIHRIELSGGIVATFRLFDRATGRLTLGGTIVCRTGMTSLRSAIALRHNDIACADGSAPRVERQANADGDQSHRPPRPPRNHDDDIFRPGGGADSGN